MVRVLLYFVLTYVMYRALKVLFSRDKGKDRPGPAGEEMVKDANCGVYLPKSSAITLGKGGQRLYFCSEECRNAYAGKAKG